MNPIPNEKTIAIIRLPMNATALAHVLEAFDAAEPGSVSRIVGEWIYIEKP